MSEVIARILTIHICLTVVGAMADTTNDIQMILSSVVSVTLIILWYLAIRSVRDRGFSRSVIVSLSFTVPSLLFGMASYYSNFYSEDIGLSMIFGMYGEIFNRPFVLISGIFSDQTSISAQIAAPIIAMNVLLLINFVEYSLEKRKKLAWKRGEI